MLDNFIIEELKRREERERNRARQDRPTLDLPLDERAPRSPPDPAEEDDKGPARGVIVIDL